MSKNELNVYYKGNKQKIKYYGPLEEDQIKKTVKQAFKIEAPLEQIYFQDEDGDILVLNSNVPSGISIHVFVEPDSIPKKPSQELKVENQNGLIKFHWIPENPNDKANNNLNVIVNKYLYTTVNDEDIHPPVRSSCTFEKGIHFFVLRKPVLSYYSMLLICEESNTFDGYEVNNKQQAIGIFNGYPQDNNNDDLFTINLGILVDMEHKRCVFYNYDTKIRRKIQYMKNGKEEEGYEASIDFKKAKVFAWLKRHACNPGKTGITILNEGCIPVPTWV